MLGFGSVGLVSAISQSSSIVIKRSVDLTTNVVLANISAGVFVLMPDSLLQDIRISERDAGPVFSGNP